MAGENRVRILAQLDDKVSNGLSRIHDRFDTLHKSKGFKAVAQGVGMGAGISIWGTVQMAVGKAVDVIGDATQAALAEEASIQKLNTALRANIPNWDGNTDAIERVLKARMDLGFSDDEQRESLTKLVAATGDVNRALDIQATAMDLARFKGIDLTAASEALVKVEAGQFRMLKSLGIELRAGATQTEALAAVQRVAANQAEDYAAINEGKLLVSQVKLGEASERLGEVGLPVVVGAMETAADAATDYANILNGLTHVTELSSDEQADLAGSLIEIAKRGFLPAELASRAATFALDTFGIKVGAVADTSRTEAENLRGAWVDNFRDMDAAAVDWRETFEDESGEYLRSARRVADKLAEHAQDAIDNFFDPIEARAELWEARQEVIAAQEAARKAKGRADSRRAAADVVEALDSQGQALVRLGEQGGLTAEDVAQFEKDVKGNFRNLSADQQAQVQAMINKLRALAKVSPINVDVNVDVNGLGKSKRDTHGPGHGFLEFASGGTVPGPVGEPRLAIVHGGEHIDKPGEWTVPRDALGRSGGGGSPVVLQIVVDGRTLAEIVDERLRIDLMRAAPTSGRI